MATDCNVGPFIRQIIQWNESRMLAKLESAAVLRSRRGKVDNGRRDATAPTAGELDRQARELAKANAVLRALLPHT